MKDSFGDTELGRCLGLAAILVAVGLAMAAVLWGVGQAGDENPRPPAPAAESGGAK